MLWKSNLIFGMPKRFELDTKQLFPTEIYLLNHQAVVKVPNLAIILQLFASVAV